MPTRRDPLVSAPVDNTSPKPSRSIEDVVNNVVHLIEQNHIRLVLMQGGVGTGKTTIAKRLEKQAGMSIVSVDEFFVVDGTYNFDENRLHLAHIDCQTRASNVLSNTDAPLVVDNCNKNPQDADTYLKLTCYKALVIHIQTKNQHEVIRCGKRSTHNVLSKNVMCTANNIRPITGPGIITMSETVHGL